MQIQQNVSLKPYNTFSMDVVAEYFTTLTSINELEYLSSETFPAQKNIIGGGSNILLTQTVKGLTILNKIKGIVVEKETDEHVWLTVGSGEVWHDLVLYSILQGWGGIENLALIPGTVGAAPIQNIGAYGVEAKETIEEVHLWLWNEQIAATYKNSDCNFGYRDSIFKHQLKNKAFITSVTFRLNKKPAYNISYGAIEQELAKMNVDHLSVRAIADAVIAIRTSKLPDPNKIGNAGSFFKNPTIPISQYQQLHQVYPAMPSYPANDKEVKIPAGWLIEQCGWKGYRSNDAGVHAKQALVLVNYANANGKDIWELSSQIVSSVKDKYGIELEREVQVW